MQLGCSVADVNGGGNVSSGCDSACGDCSAPHGEHSDENGEVSCHGDIHCAGERYGGVNAGVGHGGNACLHDGYYLAPVRISPLRGYWCGHCDRHGLDWQW